MSIIVYFIDQEQKVKYNYKTEYCPLLINFFVLCSEVNKLNFYNV
jgi:hypothetical protein